MWHSRTKVENCNDEKINISFGSGKQSIVAKKLNELLKSLSEDKNIKRQYPKNSALIYVRWR